MVPQQQCGMIDIAPNRMCIFNIFQLVRTNKIHIIIGSELSKPYNYVLEVLT